MPGKSGQPNIIIFCTDEQRSDYLGCMGHPYLHTPNIDRLAAEGTLFRNCYSSSPVCMPARATMMTGHTNRVTGVRCNGYSLDRSLPTLPGILADAGYRTHSIGKLHLSHNGKTENVTEEDIARFPERRMYWDWPGRWEGLHYKKFPDNYYGFQTVELCGGHVSYVYGDYVTWIEENHPGVFERDFKNSNQDPHPLAVDPELHYNTWIADRSIAFIEEEAEKDKPFYLWCSFPDPHEPFAAVKKWSDFYDDVDIELPPHALELSENSRCESMVDHELGLEPIDPERVKKSIKQTLGMISHVDEQIGRILNSIDQQELAEETVIMFISDHGDQLGEHGLFYKGTYPWDAHAHVPFIIKVPGAEKQGKVVDDVVSMLDLVPTALDLAGVPYPVLDNGQEMLPGEALGTVAVEAETMPKRKTALMEMDQHKPDRPLLQMRALVRNDYKLVYYPQRQESMLFDRDKDPLEQTNLAGEPEHQELLLDMMKELLAELARTEMPGYYRATAEK